MIPPVYVIYARSLTQECLVYSHRIYPWLGSLNQASSNRVTSRVDICCTDNRQPAHHSSMRRRRTYINHREHDNNIETTEQFNVVHNGIETECTLQCQHVTKVSFPEITETVLRVPPFET